LRPNAGLVAPAIAYKSSPFYELKYQVGDVKTLEGASGVTRFLLTANALVAN
jgi:E3 SUMO-protein ligase PIAS1